MPAKTRELPAETDVEPQAELRSYPLHLRQNTAAEREHLGDLAVELGYERSAWPFMALEALQRYRAAMWTYRDALAEVGLARELPVWEPWTGSM